MSYEQSFASVYDIFTESVDYKKRADYICSLMSQTGIRSGDLLDVACGTGSLSYEFLKKGFEVTAVDISPDMLSVAREKLSSFGDKVLLLCQDMCELDLYGTVDAAVCSLDSLNHLLTENDISIAIKRISLFLRPGGVFVFDVNTLYKHQNILSDRSFIYEDDNNFLAWQNSECDNEGTVDIMLDIFSLKADGSYERSSEDFSERAYSIEFLRNIVENCGLKVLKIYNDMTFDSVKDTDERAYFVTIKK